jgi:hypothetical protein
MEEPLATSQITALDNLCMEMTAGAYLPGKRGVMSSSTHTNCGILIRVKNLLLLYYCLITAQIFMKKKWMAQSPGPVVIASSTS